MTSKTADDLLQELAELDSKWPSRPTRPYLNHNPTAAEAIEFAQKLAVYEAEEASYKDRRNAHTDTQKALRNQWRDAVCREYSQLNYATANILMQYAINKHGSYAVDSIIEEMDELTTLAIDIIAINKA